MPKKKGKGKKKKGGGGGKKKKDQQKRTCGNCFEGMTKENYTNSQWKKGDMDCVCKKCEKKKLQKQKEQPEMEKKVDVKEKVVKTEKIEKPKLTIGKIPERYIPKESPKTDSEKKWEEIRSKQTEYPSCLVSTMFEEDYPLGEFQKYTGDYNMKLSENDFMVEKEKLMENYTDKINTLRHLGEVHRQLRKFVMKIAKVGVKVVDIVEETEFCARKLFEMDKAKSGFAFPLGTSLGNCAAHHTPNPGDDRILKEDDVLKIDIGLHSKGIIIDSAFSLSFSPVYDKLLESVQAATNAGVKSCGIDVRLCDVGEAIQEVMESYEVEIDGKMNRVQTIENLNGHSLGPYTIHSGITIPCTRGGPESKIQEGDHFAIETFGSIMGKGRVQDNGECSHFMMYPLVDDGMKKSVKLKKSKQLFELIQRHYKTLCFCPRWIQNIWKEKNYMVYLRNLVKNGIVKEYPPLCDKIGSVVAQYEHTLMMLPTRKEVFSRGDDY